MQCLRCGVDISGQSALCERCMAQGRIGSRAELSGQGSKSGGPFASQSAQSSFGRIASASPDETAPGGFWLRLLAFNIDWLIASVLSIPLVVLLVFGCISLGVFTSLGLGAVAEMLGSFKLDPSLLIFGPGGVVTTVLLVVFIVSVVVMAPMAIVLAAFECSSLQATPGKMLFKLKVTGSAGEKITFLRSFLRSLVKLWLATFSMIVLYAPFLMVAFSSRKRALHDMLSGTYVVSTGFVGAGRVIAGIVIILASIVGSCQVGPPTKEKPHSRWKVDGRIGSIGSEMSTNVPDSSLQATPETSRVTDGAVEDSYQPDPVGEGSKQATEIPLSATLNGKQIHFQKINASFDPFANSITVLLGQSESNGEADLKIRFKFGRTARECSPDSLESYSIEFLPAPNGYVLPPKLKNVEFSRIGSWHRSNELPLLTCKLERGELLNVIMRDAGDKQVSGAPVKFAWDLGFQTKLE